MKVCHILFSLGIGGTESMLVDILNEQAKKCTVSLIIINDIINEDIVARLGKKISVYRLERKQSSRNILPIIKLNLLLAKLNPNIIHFHQQNGVNLLLPSFRKKAVLTIHGTKISCTALQKYKKVFSVSDSVKQDIKKRYQLEPKVIYNGVDISAINKQQTSDYSPKFRIVQVSRLDYLKKGQHILLEAIRQLVYNHKITNLSLDFIGEGLSQNYLEKMAEDYKIKEYVHFLGAKERNYIYQKINTYNLLVQPSLNEGFGLTVVEAMAAKIPVLVSNIEGPMEIIKNGEYGYYFQAGNAEDCANKIIQIMNNDNLSIINKAYQYCTTNFSINTTAENYLKEYCNV